MGRSCVPSPPAQGLGAHRGALPEMLHYFKVTREMRRRRGEWQRRPPCANNFLDFEVDVSRFFRRAPRYRSRRARREVAPPGSVSLRSHPGPSSTRRQQSVRRSRMRTRGPVVAEPAPCHPAPPPPFATVAGDNGLGRAAGDAPCPPAVGKCEAQSRPVPLLLREITARDSNGSDYVAAPHLPTVIRRVAKAAAPVHPQARRRELNRLRHREK